MTANGAKGGREMQDKPEGRNALCPGCPYRAPAAAMGRLWLRGVAGGGCAGLNSRCVAAAESKRNQNNFIL